MKDVLINLIAAAVWVALGAIAARAATFLRDRLPTRSILRLDARKSLFIVTNSVESRNPEIGGPVTGIGALQAVGLAREAIARSYPRLLLRTRVVFSVGLPAEALQSNLICIGGRKYNQITSLFEHYFEPRFDFQANNQGKIGVRSASTVIRDTITDKVYEPELDRSGNDYQIDYGVITSLPNPFNPRARVILLAGAHTYGVAAAGHVLERGNIKQLTGALSGVSGNSWQILIQATCIGLDATPRIVEVASIQPLQEVRQREVG